MKEFEEARQKLDEAVDFYKQVSGKGSKKDISSAWKEFVSRQESKISNLWEKINKELL